VPEEIVKWQARKPTTNPEYARWILDAEAHGFVKYLNVQRSKVQLESLRDGKKVASADPAAKVDLPRFGGHGVVRRLMPLLLKSI